jgi:penicillin-binding protein 1A
MRRRRKFLLISGGVAAFLVLSTYFYFTKDLPTLVALMDYQPNLVTKVYSDDGQLVAEFYVERRVVVPLATMPVHLIDAFLAAEDAGFFEHEGVSYTSILRAFIKNIQAGKIVQGGSTITQQVARSFFLSREKKFSRKIREVIMAYRIERQLNKEEILNLYLNQIYLGNGAYGVEAAAQTYFGKNVGDLTVAESALLAGLPKAPNKYSPYADLDRSKKRQEYILARMVIEEFIDQETSQAALDEEFKLKPREVKSLWAGPYFTEHIRRYIEEEYGDELLYKGGLNIYTTMDLRLQKIANEAVRAGIRAFDKRRGYRGPLETFATVEEVDAFRDEVEEKLGSRPAELGHIYRGVITSVDLKKKLLNVDIGMQRGIVTYRYLRWARVYNPENASDGELVEDPLVNFSTGDVVDVLVKRLPYDESSPMLLALEQEPLVEAALIAVDPETGYVKAMVGGSAFSKTQFNRAVQAYRQPGSAFKPIIYTAALDLGYTPATTILDTPLVFDFEKEEKEVLDEFGEVVEKEQVAPVLDENGEVVEEEVEKWRPRNYDEQFHGLTTVRTALTKSRNIVTIKVLKDIGVKNAIEYAARLGITSPLASDLSLALGSSAVTLIEMTTAFATFANQGYRPEMLFISRITDKNGDVLEENVPTAEEAISRETAYIMTNLLQGVVQNGTGFRAKALGRPAAGKTGTTNNLNDAWFIGYVPNLVAGAWVGYDNEKRLGKHETGSRAAAPIWVKFMKGATEDTPIENFEVPDGVEFVKIDPETGFLASPMTEGVIFEVFKIGTTPTEFSGARMPEDPAEMQETEVRDPLLEDTEYGDGELRAPVYSDNPELMQLVQ